MADKNYKIVFGMTDGSTKSVNFTAPQGEKGETGATGETGPYYAPSVDSSGNLSWTKQSVDEAEPIIMPTNIKGPQGEAGESGVGINTITIEEV